ncbi:MAG: tRNA glutamyl-Q(34) synthetase GluQRS [Akkermansiaceae bacterium]|nr:tRNA glutamyl-Q(34) synthetase GluQRS [Akkermansiaceae bacterium]
MRKPDMPVVTRFAPSPTGQLHLGHALAAWVAWDLARSNEGRFLLRMEDIDVSRSRPEHEVDIRRDLRWLGLDWDEETPRQSERGEAYQTAFMQLQSRGLLYPCFCTRKEIQAEIEAMGGAPHGPGGDHYPGTCKRLSRDERQQRIDHGESHAWRLDAELASRQVGALDFHDQLQGTVTVDAHLLGDVVIMRKDIGISYHLAVVVDDAEQKVSHVTRGVDLLESTHVHRMLQAALELPVPQYFHHPLVLDDQGRRLAKRCDSMSLAKLREEGRSPEELLTRVRSLLA